MPAFNSLPPRWRPQVADLQARLGPPLIRTVPLGHNSYLQHATRSAREAEVCFVLQRPTGRLLVMRKTFYPPGIFRLPTGGVQPGEGALEALAREIGEETGLQTVAQRFLAWIGYAAEAGQAPAFCTFAFLVREVAGHLQPRDPREQVEAFGEVAPADLLQIAGRLEGLSAGYSGDLGARWEDWGRFRAVAHRAVWEALTARGGGVAPPRSDTGAGG
ncbi:MAG: NUDIX hydrolase [Armatimonadota bacterium]|nr:NUDIX hydrolase [Armatimonadota bacterium]